MRRIPGLKRMRLGVRWLKSRFHPGALILGYHEISDKNNDPFSICVSPEHFAGHLRALRRHAFPLRLQELVQRLHTGDLPPRSVAVTFDDGYKDHLYEAKPLLERYDIPATVFITTAYFGREYWWNELVTILSAPDTLPDRVSLSIGRTNVDWARDAPVCRRAARSPDPPRQHLMLTLYDHLMHTDYEEQQRILTLLREWTRAGSSASPVCSALNTDEVLQLAGDGLIDIGAHSATHPFLHQLPLERQQFEIQQSKSELEELLGRPVVGFSYPNGSASKRTRALVREAGFSYACDSFNDVAGPGSDRFCLPRFWPANWDEPAFAAWLRLWAAGG